MVYFDFLASAVWNRFLTAFCRYFCANVSAVTYVRASSGHHLTHWGSLVSLSVQLLHVNTIFFSGCMFMAPNWHALMHHPQPLQAFSSTRIMPLSSSCVKGVSWASCYACGVFTVSASNCQVYEWSHAHGAYS